MLKQSPSRNQRSKGFKVKHVLQMFLLLSICIWLIYQMKHSHDKKRAYDEESSTDLVGKMQSDSEFIRLGRRDLRPLVKDTSYSGEKQENKEEEEVEEGAGVGDDEIDVNDRERAEEEESEGAEDLIDEEDRDRDEGIEEDEKGIDLEDVNSMDDQDDIEEGKSYLEDVKEEHYKNEDEVDEVDLARDMRGINRSLRNVQVKEVESVNNEVEKENETYSQNATSADVMVLLAKESTVNETKLNLASDSSHPTSNDADADTDGSPSIVSLRTLQRDATTNGNAVLNEGAKMKEGIYSGEESSMTSTTIEKSDTVDDEEEEKAMDSD